MDPNAALAEIRRLAAMALDEGFDCDDRGQRLAELVQALDEWLSKGGFLPTAWDGAGEATWEAT